MKKNVIVTGADRNYFPFLRNLIKSIHRTGTIKECDLCILKVDKDNQYLDEIVNLVTSFKQADFSMRLSFSEKKNWFKLLTERPFIKDYFPGYENYIWLDADTEILSVDGIKNLIAGTIYKDLSIVPEINEAYVFKNKKFGLKKIFSSYYKISGWSFKNYNKYLKKGLGEDLFFKPLFNNGVFCLKAQSQIWEVWKKNYQYALDNAKTDYGIKTDQLSLNKIIYDNFDLISILDSTNNWIIDKSEKVIMSNGTLYTPSLPMKKINIIHYTNKDKNDYFEYLENNKICKKKIIA